jgi:hypothetical protein
MKEYEIKKTITYRWWREGNKDIKSEHIEALEETATTRIFEMLAEGYTSGELYENIRMTDNDPEDGVEYSGWWEITTKRI